MNNVSWLAIGLFAFGSGERAIAISRWRCSFNWAMPLEWLRQIKRHANKTDFRCMAALFHEDTDRIQLGREASRRFGGSASKVIRHDRECAGDGSLDRRGERERR